MSMINDVLIVYEREVDKLELLDSLNHEFVNSKIKTANSKEQLLRLLIEKEYQVVFMFCNLSWITCIECIKKIKTFSIESSIFVFFLERDNEKIQKVLSEGIDDYSFSTPSKSIRLKLSFKHFLNKYYTQTEHLLSKLKENNVLFRTLFANAPSAIALTDRNGKINRINDKFTELFGYSQTEAIGKNIDELISIPENINEARENNRIVLEKKFIAKKVVRKSKAGEHLDLSLKSNLINYGGGEYGFYAIYDDITKLTNIQKELENSQIFMQSLLDSLNMRIVTINHKGEIIYLSKFVIDHYRQNYGKDIFIGDNILLNQTNIINNKYEDKLKQALKGKTSEFISPGDEEQEFLSVKICPVYSGDEIIGATLVGYDISDLIRSQEKLKIAIEKAKTSEHAKSQFLSTMSHEIRTPMNGVLGMTQLLKNTSLNKEQLDYVNVIQSAGSTLLSIINDVLDIAKLESTQFKLNPEVCKVSELINDICYIQGLKCKEKGLKLNCIFPKELDYYYYVDQVRIKQILFNLINNAVKYTEEGEINIYFSQESRENYYKIVVEDTGCGISEEDQKNIFNEFVQTENTVKKQAGGTGLGLAITKKLVEAMKGSITLKSQENIGSSFIVSLYIAKADKEQIKKYILHLDENTTSESENKRFKLNNYHILVAEDNKINQKLITKVMEKAGIPISMVSNGQEAYEYCLKNKVDVVLMDIEMPVCNGIEATKLIRENIKDYQPIIIAQTANAIRGDREKYLSLGMDDYIAKPINIKNFLKKIEEVIIRKKQ